MSDQTEASRGLFRAFPYDLEGFRELAGLALDLRASWNHASEQVWRALDPVLWDLTHNPWAVLRTASRDHIEKLLADPEFRGRVDQIEHAKREALAKPAWFQQAHPQSPLKHIAYFSMEFMLSEALPIYSGGLGNVAGDQLKAASDLGVPVTGVSLLYSQGYFRQVIDANGGQQAMYPYNDPGQLPIVPLRGPNGDWLRLQLNLPGHSIWLRAWQVQVGRVKLYLLDSNDVANYPAYRGITSELYGGGSYLRLMQELVLGIGGWRLLAALGIEPEVCHLNEGHAAFAVLERARSFMSVSGLPFHAALAATSAGNLFTTHTAVAAGFDRFAPDLIESLLGDYARTSLGISSDELLGLGRQNPHDPTESFNMAYLAIRGSAAVNAVSRLHGVVSRSLFQSLFPRWPTEEVPVGYVTNGVHTPTWVGAGADALWAKVCGPDRWVGNSTSHDAQMGAVEPVELWQFRSAARKELIEYARERISRELATSGAAPGEVAAARRMFDPDVLTIAFARRFATYKRPNLLLHDPQRLLRILTNTQRPVQLIMAGKAHPADEPGQALIRQWVQFIRNTEARRHVIFLSDYDMLLTERLVQGADVWLNTPRRPWEASGTSGMKVLVNGGINLSELDGWWAEAYTPEVGWALGDGREHGDDPQWDAAEAEALYQLLEREVIPEFYTRDGQGIPLAWVERVRASMAQLTGQFSTSRTVREYTEKFYLPGAKGYAERSANKGALGDQISRWRTEIEEKGASVRFGEIKVSTAGGQHSFEAQVYLNGLAPEAVRVELFASGEPPLRQEMRPLQQLVGTGHAWAYGAQVSASRPARDYTARVVPSHVGVAVPLEAPYILWQH
ncbi:MAG TPA: alpha-glucan family phosphorylase [Steroidobacteraceae bacterium]|nr:alpha-glucan family phosphorylase [Steroidobacteraceae bacterium]